MGDGQATSSIGGVEPQYATAKTSVWWDIENCQVPKGCDPYAIAKNISSALVKMNYCGPITISAYGDTTRINNSVQQALSSTGIALNHVPAGVKDASDKKILVDMLFWAVDNPAPANYLLISGDRDFSNALHQLGMRRYNILLAQPIQASAALKAAAKYVWRWTSLVNGEHPFSTGDFSNASKTQTVSAPPPPSPNKANITRTTSLPVKLEETKPVRMVMKAPHEFFSTPTSSSNSNIPTHNLGNKLIQPQPLYFPDTLISVPSKSDGPCVSGSSGFIQSNPVFNRWPSKEDFRPKSMVVQNPNTSFPNNSQSMNQLTFSDPKYVQGLIGVILITLNTLKIEQITPTVENITNCIRYGDPKFRNIDVRKALEYAIDRNMILKKPLGGMEVYFGRTERLWRCENPRGGNVEQYSHATWAAIQDFITSSAGICALKASECSYEAALILKNSCLRTLPLGEVLKILNMVITVKQWIKHADFGWQPITISLLEAQPVTGNGI